VNGCENYFGILKRGINGVYPHVSPTHLKRYVGEFDFRSNNRIGLGVSDFERTEKVAKGAVRKRLTYERTRQQPEAEASQPLVLSAARSRRFRCGRSPPVVFPVR
jgi:hypothetical protein